MWNWGTGADSYLIEYWHHLAPSSNIKGLLLYTPKGLWWDFSNDTRFIISSVKVPQTCGGLNRNHYTPHLWHVGCYSFDIVCLSVRVSVTTLTAERTDIQTWILALRLSGKTHRYTDWRCQNYYTQHVTDMGCNEYMHHCFLVTWAYLCNTSLNVATYTQARNLH